MGATGTDAGAVLRDMAAATLIAQRELDELALAAADRWDDTGVPPWAGAHVRLHAGLRSGVRLAPRTAAGTQSRLLMVEAGHRRPARIRIAFALRPVEEAGND